MKPANERGLAAVAEAALSSTSVAALATGAVAAAPAVVAAAAPDAAATAAREKTIADQARAEGKAEGVKEGATAERARVKSILSADKAKGRDQLAQSLALNTELSAEAAIAVLADAPEGARASRLDAIVPRPEVTADEPGTAATAQAAAGADLAAAVKAQVGKRPGH